MLTNLRKTDNTITITSLCDKVFNGAKKVTDIDQLNFNEAITVVKYGNNL
jgi:hypothetical protein